MKISGHWSIQTVWTTPGDDSTQVDTSSSGSDFKISAPGFGVIVHGAGLSYPDGTHHGTATEFPSRRRLRPPSALRYVLNATR